MYFFTADEHYGHANIIKYCNRPFNSLGEMNDELIRRHNAAVRSNDIVLHLGDFCLGTTNYAESIISRLNGTHCFIPGSHDKWMNSLVVDAFWNRKYSILPPLYELTLEQQYITCCHYAMSVWPRSHYNSWQIYGHSHGRHIGNGKQYDVGVDSNNFYPVSFTTLKDIMSKKQDNYNLVRKPRGNTN